MTKKIFRALILFAALVAGSCTSYPTVPSKTLYIAVPYELDSLDPHEKSTLSNFAILSHFYESLVTTDRDMKIGPCLARRWENPDALTWIFHLQPGIRFHSGEPMGAEDVIYSLQRLMNNSYLQVSAYLPNVVNIRAPDLLTVEIRTNVPTVVLLNKLRFVLIIPKGATSESLSQKVDGTGPYRLVEWDKSEGKIMMIRNDKYWNAKPDIQRVDFYLNRTPEEAIGLLRSGQCRFAQCNSKELTRAIIHLRNFQMLRSSSLWLKFMNYDLLREVTPYCNVTPNPFRKRLVRQAMHIGIDREALVQGLHQYATPATQPIPPFVFGFNSNIPLPIYDPAKAKALLQQAGLPQGFQTTLLTRHILADAGKLIQEQLDRIGIHCELKILPDVDFFFELDKKNMSLKVDRFGCTTGDAGEVLSDALHSIDPLRHLGRYNDGGYSNPKLDQAIEQSNVIEETEPRLTQLQNLLSLVMEDLPWIPLYFDQDSYAVDKAYSWQPRSDGYVFAAEIKIVKD